MVLVEQLNVECDVSGHYTVCGNSFNIHDNERKESNELSHLSGLVK